LEKKSETLLIFALLGILVVSAIYFNPNKSGEISKFPKAIYDCERERYCVDSDTYAVRSYDCRLRYYDCGTNEFCQDGSCQISACKDECSPVGTRECTSSTGYRVCGNYDNDTCLEWSGIAACSSGTTCEDGACVETNITSTGTAYFTSNPTGATVWSFTNDFWGTTPFTKEFNPDTYTSKAKKDPFYQSFVYRTFTINSGQQTNVYFILNQTHHSGCTSNFTGDDTCSLLAGSGSIGCLPIGSSCSNGTGGNFSS